MNEWMVSKNLELGLNPKEITIGSHIKAWWVCKNGHHWEAEIKSRAINKNGCPYCSGQKVLTGYNDLSTLNPILARDWHPKKNDDLLPSMITIGSGKKVWWKCQNGHEWQASVKDRNNGRNCPYCSGKKILLGFNDLVSTHPFLEAEWNYEKNKELLPTMVTSGSNKKVWWKCSLGHEWQANISSRALSGNGCPYCSGKKVLSGFNDLVTTHPEIVKEWHPTKNNIQPTTLSAGSGKKVWWICRKGHEWQAVIENRTILHMGCPICNQEISTSFPEQAILFYCSKVTSAKSRNTDFGKEIDIYLPEFKIGIEYNGIFFHKNKRDADKKKIKYFSEKNIRIITVAEGKQNRVYDSTIEYIYSSNKNSLNWAIGELFKMIDLPEIPINTLEDASEIYSQYITYEKENSLEAKYPEISKEWNYEKNLSLKPNMVLPGSGKKVWWKCKKGHEWQASVYHRTTRNQECPYCSGNKVLSGFNDLATINPEIANEWNYNKNEDLLPTMVTIKSTRKVWWKCKEGHEWQASVYHRAIRKQECPYCSGNKVLSGFNDLATINPNLITEWDYNKNEISPERVSPNSHRIVWWKCKEGHEWQASVKSRNFGNGCPYCSGRNAIPNVNDFATLNPDVALEWDYDKNGDLLPTSFLPNSNKKVWWKCKNCGNSWNTQISVRNKGSGCPICANKNSKM